MSTAAVLINPKLDLVLERIADVPRELVWAAWTQPEHLKKWFTPAPWKTTGCDVDLRPGGIFRTVMGGPEGEEFTGTGCILEVVPNEKLVWTSALEPGYRPKVQTPRTGPNDEFYFTAVITLEEHGTGTKYTATLIHGDEASARTHEGMGFHHGWGAAFDQLVALVKTW